MLTFKFQRIGKKKQAHFRLIIQEKSKNPKSNVLEILGWYNPRSKAKEFKTERIQYWLAKGAEATPTVHNLFIDAGLIQDGKVKTVRMSKKRAAKLEADKKAEVLKTETLPENKTEEVKPVEEIKEAVVEETKSAEAEEVKEAPAEEIKKE